MRLEVRHYRAIQVFSIGASMLIFVGYGGWLFSRPIESFATHGLPGVTPPEYARSFSINHGNAVFYRDGVPSEHPYKEGLVYVGIFSAIAPFVWADSRIRKLLKSASVSPGAEFRRGLRQVTLALALLSAIALILITLFNRAA